MTKLVFLLSFLLMASAGVNAQPQDLENYRKESENLRKRVWAWDKPQFNVREVPAQYAKASKVILAHHTELTADSKSKFVFLVITAYSKKELTLTETVRELIKINDKNAVAEYSELSFTQFQKSSGFFDVSKTTIYVGVRVIKPNGSIKEINADDIVLTKDESKEKKAKLAIPDLEPGDILDYFIATEQFTANDYSDKPYQLNLFDDAPVLSYSFHAQLGKKYAVEYRSYNGAPDLQVSKNDDKEIVIDIEKTNMPPFETSMWVAPGIQLPFIRMNISMGYRGPGSKAMDSKKPGELTKLTISDLAIDGKTSQLNSIFHQNYWYLGARRQYSDLDDVARKKAKQMGLDFKQLNDDEKAALLYYTFRYTKLLNFNIETLSKNIDIGAYNFNDIGVHLYCLVRIANLNSSILLSGTRTGVRINEAMDAGNVNAVAYLDDTKKILSLETVYDLPFSIPDQIEGLTETKLLTFTNKATSVKNDFAPGPEIPISGSDKNAHIENLKLSLSPDKNTLLVRRSTTLKGHYKTDIQRQLILYEDYYESERKAFNDKRSLLEELEDGKKSKSFVDEVKNAFAEARKKQKDAFIKEAKDWLELDITDFKDYKTDNLGVRHTAPDFVYSSSFSLGGLVKKAGNNVIVEIGKIQGQPLVVKEEQRKRDIDVYMPFARSIEYNVELEIPEGYTAEGVAALNKKVENETGFFSAEASVSGKIVSIKIKKHYLHSFEPAKNWSKLLAFMDAANDWVSAKLLLKKM